MGRVDFGVTTRLNRQRIDVDPSRRRYYDRRMARLERLGFVEKVGPGLRVYGPQARYIHSARVDPETKALGYERLTEAQFYERVGDGKKFYGFTNSFRAPLAIGSRIGMRYALGDVADVADIAFDSILRHPYWLAYGAPAVAAASGIADDHADVAAMD
jgi:hypothetical protein